MWDAERHGRVTVLTYTLPPQNLLGFADLAELDQVLQHWADDERARVIVLTGGLPGYFAAHADLAHIAALVHGALRIGLIDVIVPGEEFLDAVLDWAAPLAAQLRHSLAAAKQALQLSTQLALDQGISPALLTWDDPGWAR